MLRDAPIPDPTETRRERFDYLGLGNVDQSARKLRQFPCAQRLSWTARGVSRFPNRRDPMSDWLCDTEVSAFAP